MSNREILEDLFEARKIDIRRSDLFDTVPDPMPKNLDFGRVEGMMLGLAVGDSLGKPTEGMLPENRRARLGEIKDYLPSLDTDGPNDKRSSANCAEKRHGSLAYRTFGQHPSLLAK